MSNRVSVPITAGFPVPPSLPLTPCSPQRAHITAAHVSSGASSKRRYLCRGTRSASAPPSGLPVCLFPTLGLPGGGGVLASLWPQHWAGLHCCWRDRGRGIPQTQAGASPRPPQPFSQAPVSLGPRRDAPEQRPHDQPPPAPPQPCPLTPLQAGTCSSSTGSCSTHGPSQAAPGPSSGCSWTIWC